MNHAANKAYLELVAAKANQLLMDYNDGKLWPGELWRGVQDIQETLNKIDTRIDR